MSDKNNVISIVQSQENTALQQLEIDLHNAIVKAIDADVSPIAIVGLMQCHITMQTQLLLQPDLID